MTINNTPKKKPWNKWLSLINIPFQMGVIIFLFSCFGNWLDEKYPDSNLAFSTIFVMIGVGIALYNVIRQVNDINKTS